MGTAPAFASVGEAMDMVRAGLGYLAAADADPAGRRDPGRVPAGAGAGRRDHTAARASFLAAFTAGRAIPRTRTTARGPG